MIELELPFQPPFDWEAMLAFYAARCVAGIERVEGDRYVRTFALADARGSFAVSHGGKTSLRVALHVDEERALPRVVARLRAMLDLDADMRAVDARLALAPQMAARVAARPGVRLPGTWDGFEAALRAILGQQISVAAAITLTGRIAAALGERIPEELAFEGGPTLLFPSPPRFAAADLSGLGLTRMRVRTLHELARAAVEDEQLLDPTCSLEQLEQKLIRLPGIGPWTAQYVALRGLYFRDAFPAADLGLLRAMETERGRPSARELAAAAEVFRPFRGYAVIRLWTQPLRP